MGILDSLGSLVSNIKQLSLPGILVATACAILLWPPTTVDRVPIPKIVDNKPSLNGSIIWPINSAEPDAELVTDSRNPLYTFVIGGKPACETPVLSGPPSLSVNGNPTSSDPRWIWPLVQGRTVKDIRAAAVYNQLLLEQSDAELKQCLEEEHKLDGIEDLAIGSVNDVLTKRNAERSVIAQQYQTYLQQASPVTGHFRTELAEIDSDIQYWQAISLHYSQVKQDRLSRIAELNRLDQNVQGFLGEPGRLRPKQRFDDFLNSLGTHVVGLLALIFGWSLFLTPINNAFFAYVYDTKFDGMWDDLKPARVTDPDIREIRRETRNSVQGPNYALLKMLIFTFILVIAILLSCSLSSSTPTCDIAGTNCILNNPTFQSYKGDDAWIFVACVLTAVAGWMTAYYFPQVVLNLRVLFDTDQTYLGGKKRSTRQVSFTSESVLGDDQRRLDQAAASAPQKEPIVIRRTTGASFKALFFASKPTVPVTGATASVKSPQPTDANQKTADNKDPELAANTKDAISGNGAKQSQGEANKPKGCSEKLQTEWPKLSQPEYAIGLQVFAASDYQALQQSFLSDSQISVGMVLPSLLLIWALLYTTTFEIPAWLLLPVLGLGQMLLVLAAVDRRHKFKTATDNAIAGGFMAKCKTDKANKSTPANDTINKLINSALDAATIAKKTKLKILPGTPSKSPDSTSTPPAQGQGSTSVQNSESGAGSHSSSASPDPGAKNTPEKK